MRLRRDGVQNRKRQRRPRVTWILAGVGVLLFLPTLVVGLLAFLHVWLQKHYLQYIVRIYQEVPFFNVPRGQPRAGPRTCDSTTADRLTLREMLLQAAPHGGACSALDFNRASRAGVLRSFDWRQLPASLRASRGSGRTTEDVTPLHWRPTTTADAERPGIPGGRTPTARHGLVRHQQGARAGILTARAPPSAARVRRDIS